MPEYIYPPGTSDTVLSEFGITMGYVLSRATEKAYDPNPLADAAERVAQKWPFLAGKFIQDKKSGRFYIRIPAKTGPNKAIKFTIATHNTSIPLANASRLKTGTITKRPPVHYFRHPSTPFAIEDYISQDHPIVSLHVSHLDNAVCIGLATSHGMFDGTGLRMIMKAIHAELAGHEWAPPQFKGYNVVTEAMSLLPQSKEKTRLVHNLEFTFPKPTFSALFRYKAMQILETWWYGSEYYQLFLHDDHVKGILEPVKSELQADGHWASTGDILLAWFLKAALSEEGSKPSPVIIITMASTRRVLAQYDPLAADNPHNSIGPFPMDPFTHAQIASMSVAQLAKKHRDHVTDIYEPTTIRSYADFFGPPDNINDVCEAAPTWDTTVCTVSNLMNTKLPQIEFGSGTEVVAYWPFSGPQELRNLVFIERARTGDGVVFTGAFRKSRWDAVRNAVAKIANAL